MLGLALLAGTVTVWGEVFSPAGTGRVVFSSLTTADGLPPGKVSCMLQDQRGFLWFGTEDGLVRYDGYEMRVFRHDPEDPQSLSGDAIEVLYEDSRGTLWVGVGRAGLNRFDPSRETNTRFRHEDGNASSLRAGAVTSVLEDDRGEIWVATTTGIDRLDQESGSFHHVAYGSGDAKGVDPGSVRFLFQDRNLRLWAGTEGQGLGHIDMLREKFLSVWDPGVAITAITQDSNGLLWIGTAGDGLIRFDPTRAEVVQQFHHDPSDPGSLASRDVHSVFADSKGDIWAGTLLGLSRFDARAGRFVNFRSDSQDSTSLVGDHVLVVYEDRKQVLWVGSANGGVSRFDLNQYWFPHFRARPGAAPSLSHNSVWGVHEDSEGMIWLGTESGLNRFDPVTGAFSHYRHDPSDPSGLSSDYAYVLHEDGDRRLWVGTRGGGLNRLDAARREISVFRKRAGGAEGEGIPHDSVTALWEDREGNLWVGTHGGGICRFDKTREEFRQYGQAGESGREVPAATQFISDIREDGAGRLWVGTAAGGLYVLKPESDQYVSYEAFARPGQRLASDAVSVIYEDTGGVLWIGTLGGGLHRFDPDSGAMQIYGKSNMGLPHADVHGIVGDERGYLWISTGGGLVRFDTGSASFRRFGADDGLQSDVFHAKAFHRTREGYIVFGGSNGFNFINPRELPRPRQAQRPLLTGLELFGERVIPSPDGILKRPLALTEVLQLSYDEQSRISFNFATLHYTTPHRSHFRFRMEGLETSWNLAGEERKATYTAVPPGNYTFMVQASLDGQDWLQDTARIAVEITPPWYEAWWAKLGLGVVAAGLLSGVIGLRVRAQASKAKNQRERLEMERNKAEAALARQLQHVMLLERTTQEFRQNLTAKQVFETAVSQLGEHFEVDRCHILRYSSEPEEQLLLAAEFASEFLTPMEGDELPCEGIPFVERVLAFDRVVVSEDANTDPQLASVRDLMKLLGTGALAAVRTSFMDQANGMILLHRSPGKRLWERDELQLLESVAAQVGIAIAQMELARREEEQRQELEVAKGTAESANQAKSDFLAKMTHELRTPLHAVIGFSQMISEDTSTTHKQRELLDIINSSGEHLLDIINDVLEMSKIEAGHVELVPERFDLQRLLKSVHQMLAARIKSEWLDFRFVEEGPLPKWVVTDKGKLRQILINILGNAAKFTEKGHITLKVWTAQERDGDRRKGGKAKLMFEIQDTGAGIAEAELSTLFDEFAQTEAGRKSHQGTGLGLAITRNFVELLGGEISADSTLGKGTVFRFHVLCEAAFGGELAEGESQPESGKAPAYQEPGDVPIGAGSTETEAGEGTESKEVSAIGIRLAPDQDEVRVLIAEDQPVNRLLAVKILRAAGFQMEEAENGQVAVEKWRTWRPQLILMDEDMPIMRGMEATKAILEEAGDDPPVIISLTAYALDDTRLASLRAGCRDFLSKPFKNIDLLKIIAKHLEVRYVRGEDGAEEVTFSREDDSEKAAGHPA